VPSLDEFLDALGFGLTRNDMRTQIEEVNRELEPSCSLRILRHFGLKQQLDRDKAKYKRWILALSRVHYQTDLHRDAEDRDAEHILKRLLDPSKQLYAEELKQPQDSQERSESPSEDGPRIMKKGSLSEELANTNLLALALLIDLCKRYPSLIQEATELSLKKPVYWLSFALDCAERCVVALKSGYLDERLRKLKFCRTYFSYLFAGSFMMWLLLAKSYDSHVEVMRTVDDDQHRTLISTSYNYINTHVDKGQFQGWLQAALDQVVSLLKSNPKALFTLATAKAKGVRSISP
jgi:hypothetical protein